MQYVIWT